MMYRPGEKICSMVLVTSWAAQVGFCEEGMPSEEQHAEPNML